MNIDSKLDLLKQMKEVDAPPFLLTRIRQRIHNLQQAEAPVKWKWGFALTSVVILALNISILLASSASNAKKNNGIENIVSSMNLSTTNDLYNE
jgi:hypothetical protein